jgi:mannose-6-phosphate isomerase-like protein (cupin superfamily)
MRAAPGFARSILWITPAEAQVPVAADDAATRANLHPEPGETIFIQLTLPPDSLFASEDFDPQAFSDEGLVHNAGIFDRMEADGSGRHTTDTVDYNIIVDGEVWLETADGKQTRIGPGEVVVQTGTRHAWRNKSDRPVTMFTVLIGARRRS